MWWRAARSQPCLLPPRETAPAALPGGKGARSPKSLAAEGTGGARGRRLTSWRTPWTTTRGRGCRCTILAAGLGGDSPHTGLAHLRSGEEGSWGGGWWWWRGGGAGRTERRDTPPRLSPLTGRWQAAARPRHCRSAPRRASRLRGRPWRAGGGKAGRRRREAAAQPGRAAAATPRGEEGKPSHRPPPRNGGLAARRRPEPAAPLPVMVLPGWRSRPAGPKLRRAVVKRGGAARSRRALRRPRCPGRGGPPPAKLKAAAAPPPPRSHPPPPCPEGKGGPGGQSLASPAGEAIPALPSLREPPPPGPAVGLRLWCKRRDR